MNITVKMSSVSLGIASEIFGWSWLGAGSKVYAYHASIE